MTPRLGRRIIACLLLAAANRPASAQDITCSACQLRVEKIAELSSQAADAAPSMFGSVVRTSGGVYLVSHHFRGPPILAYRPDGSLLSSYERNGRGPGEFIDFPFLLIAPGDTLIAVADGRLSHFAAPDLVLARTQPISIDIGRAVFTPGA